MVNEVSGGRMVTSSVPQRTIPKDYSGIRNFARGINQFYEEGKLFDGFGKKTGKSISDKVADVWYGREKEAQHGVVGKEELDDPGSGVVVEEMAAPVKPIVEATR